MLPGYPKLTKTSPVLSLQYCAKRRTIFQYASLFSGLTEHFRRRRALHQTRLARKADDIEKIEMSLAKKFESGVNVPQRGKFYVEERVTSR